MEICFNKLSGLALLRRARASGAVALAEVCGLPAPDPSPQRRWTKRIIPHDLLGMAEAPSGTNPVYVAAPAAELRPQASFIVSTTYSSGLPAGSFWQLGDGLVIPCPELLFVELANSMHPAALDLLGYELCGSYSRDPKDPRCGPVEHGLEPVTDVERLRSFISRCGSIKGKVAALRSLDNVCDNAWSAMEAICSLFMRRDAESLGYELGGVSLNVRQDMPRELVSRGCARSRVPDIVLDEHPVGFNYDGRDHLDLDAILDGVDSVDKLVSKLAQIRGKYVDDRRRDRELAASGRVVLPIVSEDIFDQGGLDTIVIEALMASEQLGGPPRSESSPEQAWQRENVRARQRLLWSLLPWRGGESLGAY